jgi:DegV family protein with EDD domain
MRVIGKTQVIVDSASYLPAGVLEKYGIVVVPLTVVVDGESYKEFVDIDGPTFYERLSNGAKVATSQPSPGEFVEAFEAAQAAGAERVVAILIGSTLSGSVNSARIAAEMVSIPVHIIDTGVASFAEGLCAWEACEVLEAGGTLEAAEAVAVAVAKGTGSVFIVKGLELLRSGGRMKDAPASTPAGVPVLVLEDGAVRPKAVVTTVDLAMGLMMSELQAAIAANPGKTFRCGISNGAADELAGILEARVRALPEVTEAGQYIVGPAVGAHTGPGCTGIVFVARPV